MNDTRETRAPAGTPAQADVILVGGGIMSATLGAMLKCLDPRLRIQVFEAHAEPARESSDGWNNAGTGHAGFCELTYTPHLAADGTVDVARAVAIREQFEHSLQFWSFATANGMVGDPDGFIHAVPHLCFVNQDPDLRLLRARHAAMARHHFFRAMAYTEDAARLAAWMPLIMEGRPPEPMAATRADQGTDIDFGTLARRLLGWLAQQEGCAVATGRQVTKLSRRDGTWEADVRATGGADGSRHRAAFVFVGAGGGTIPLLRATGLGEVAGLGGFPVGGQWLVCDDPALAARHAAKVYGATHGSAPSLGGPHLDVRVLAGRRQLLFGPFASWTSRFLKTTGHWTDLPGSLRADNIGTLLMTGRRNFPLIRYLVGQATQRMAERLAALRTFYPGARAADWRLCHAGIRVQTLRRANRGAIYFGTEVFAAAGGSLTAMLGASPGASVSVNIALDVIRASWPHLLATADGHARLQAMIPSCDEDLKLAVNAGLCERRGAQAREILRLDPPASPPA